jgi:rhodanese-related sulfurtransferase
VVPDFSTPIVVYYDRGERAVLAADNLLKMSYQNVRSLKGGLQNWLESGGVVEIPNRVWRPAYGLSRRVE